MKNFTELNMECNIEKLKELDFPLNNRFTLKINSEEVCYDLIINLNLNSKILLILNSDVLFQSEIYDKSNQKINFHNEPFDYSTIYYHINTGEHPSKNKSLNLSKYWITKELSNVLEIIIEKIITSTTIKSKKNILLYGEKSEGYRVLQLATLIKESLAIVMNPQLKLKSIPENNNHSYQSNIIDLIKKEKYTPNIYLYLDLKNNLIYKEQYKDFLRKIDELPIENDIIHIKIIEKQKENMKTLNEIYPFIENVIILRQLENTNRLKLLSEEIKYQILELKQKKYLQKYALGRVDLKCLDENSIELIQVSDNDVKIITPQKTKSNQNKMYIFQSMKGIMDIKIRCINKGTLKISLKGKYSKGKANIFPVYIDFKKLAINDEIIFNKSTVVWHNKPSVYKMEVNDGEILNIHTEWLPINNKSNVQQVHTNIIKENKNFEKKLNKNLEKIKENKITLRELKRKNKELQKDKVELLIENSELKRQLLLKNEDNKNHKLLNMFSNEDKLIEEEQNAQSKNIEEEQNAQSKNIPLPGQLNPLKEKFYKKSAEKIEHVTNSEGQEINIKINNMPIENETQEKSNKKTLLSEVLSILKDNDE